VDHDIPEAGQPLQLAHQLGGESSVAPQAADGSRGGDPGAGAAR
jgi:hypothetical protein